MLWNAVLTFRYISVFYIDFCQYYYERLNITIPQESRNDCVGSVLQNYTIAFCDVIPVFQMDIHSGMPQLSARLLWYSYFQMIVPLDPRKAHLLSIGPTLFCSDISSRKIVFVQAHNQYWIDYIHYVTMKMLFVGHYSFKEQDSNKIHCKSFLTADQLLPYWNRTL